MKTRFDCNQLFRLSRRAATVAAGLAITLAAAPLAADQETPLRDDRESYAFARTVEGGVSVAPAGQGVGDDLEQNQPLLTGDRLATAPRARLEVLLPDRNRLVLDGDTVVRLEQLAFSGDREARVTILVLEQGELVLEVSDEALGDELPRIESQGGTVYIEKPGTYRVAAGGEGWIELVTRDGYAELVTDRGSTIVRSGEMALANGDRWGRVELSRAEPADSLERWSDGLLSRAASGGRSTTYVDGRLSYAASSLDDAGDWIVVENVSYWRPRVSVGWRPYWQGRWAWTPSGYTWVSYEPWGWVPYHYGTWCLVHGSWAWRPGRVYSPAWVYWHWTDGYAGWVPVGYYTNYYSPWYRGGFRFGVYGWAGGNWGFYDHWNFAPVNCFRDRHYRGKYRTGRDYQQESRHQEVPRGLITTDTRDFRPDRIDHAGDILHEIGNRRLNNGRGQLSDVTDFVGRKRELPQETTKAILRDTPNKPAIDVEVPRVASTPGWRSEEPKPGAPGTRGAGTRVAVPSTPVRESDGTRGSSGRTISTPRVDDGRVGVPEGNSGRVARTPTPAAGNRQGWKERSPESVPTVSSRPTPSPGTRSGGTRDSSGVSAPRSQAPVERVISGTRKPTPSGNGKGESGRTTVTPAPSKEDGSSGSNGSSRQPVGRYETRSFPGAPSVPSQPSSSTPRSRSSAPSSPSVSSPRSSAPRTSSPAPAPRVVQSPPPVSQSSPRSAPSASSGRNQSGSRSGSKASSAPSGRSSSSSRSSSSKSTGSSSGSNSGSKKDGDGNH
ncbi:MAG: DUF6600 domain-containing protein [Thermoanaerobaculia bacterium]